jgi:DNA-binding transcriptional MocR family regulator
VALVGNIAAIGCASTEHDATTVPSTSQPPSGLPEDSMAKVAEILGISQQKLEDAFAQAQSEMAASRPGNEQPPFTPRGEPPTGVPSEGMPPAQGFPTDLLARVAEILGIEQQTLADAFAQVQGEMPAGPFGAPPNNGSSQQ